MNSKRILAVAALLLTLPVMANAQTSRVEGMSLQGDYLKDYTGIYTYPSQVPNVGNLVYGEFGNDAVGIALIDDRSVGAVLGNLWDGRVGTWAIHLREWTPALGQGDVASHPGVGNGTDENLNTNESFDLMWGQRFGGTSVGLRLNRSQYLLETNTPTTMTKLTSNLTFLGANFNRNIMGFGGGIGFEVNPSTTFEASFLYQGRSFEVTTEPVSAGPGNLEDDGKGSYLLAARAMWQWQSDVVIVPVFKWYSFDYSTKFTSAAGAVTSTEASVKGWQIGAAGNWTLGSNDLFVLGLTFAQNKLQQDAGVFTSGLNPGASYEAEVTETYMPVVFAALETHLNSWLTMRFGAQKGAFAKAKSEGADATEPKVELTFSDFDMNLGCGVKVGTLQFDAILATDFFQNLGYLGSGQSSNTTFSGGYFPKVTATYAF